MAFNFLAIHAAIKVAIAGDDFAYVLAEEWGNFEQGTFPEALNNRSFSIRIGDLGESTFEHIEGNRLQITVEFCLELGQDAYLASLALATTAIGSLTSITAESLCDIVDDEGQLQHFNTLYLERDTGKGKVIVQFPNIFAEIQE